MYMYIVTSKQKSNEESMLCSYFKKIQRKSHVRNIKHQAADINQMDLDSALVSHKDKCVKEIVDHLILIFIDAFDSIILMFDYIP